jgi:(2Fe-2S) ferredoxin
MGTVCYLKGADKISETICREFGVEPGGTTPDRLFSFQPVNCVGACALAPVMIVDGEYHDGVSPESAMDILNKLSAEESGEDIPVAPESKTQVKAQTKKKIEEKSKANALTEIRPSAGKASTKKTAAKKTTKAKPQTVKAAVKKPALTKASTSGGETAAKKTTTKPKTQTKASTAGKSSFQKVAKKAPSQTKTSKSKAPPKKTMKKVQPGEKTVQKDGTS